jgi:ElaB/YqjD/DUF883 family membrane-anchored ribosome-binding protein
MREQEDNRRPEEIESDIERRRAEVSSTIDAIQSRLTPGQMMDQAFAYARTSLPADFGANLGNTVRENPVPVALIGIGIGWLMMQGQRPPRRATRFGTGDDRDVYATGSVADSDTESTGSKIRRMASRAEEKSREMKDQASETGHDLMNKASEIGQRISDRTSSIADRAHDVTQQTRNRMSDAAGSARARAGELGQRSQEQYYQAKDSISHLMDEQPLMVGALGLAIGTLLGALLPGTQREDELMGESRDRLLDSARDTVREKAGPLKESAQHVAQTAEREVRSAANEMASARPQGNGNAQPGNFSSSDTVTPDQQSLH